MAAALEAGAGLAGGVGVGAAALDAGAGFGASAAAVSAHAERGDNETSAATLTTMAEVRGTLWVIATSPCLME